MKSVRYASVEMSTPSLRGSEHASSFWIPDDMASTLGRSCISHTSSPRARTTTANVRRESAHAGIFFCMHCLRLGSLLLASLVASALGDVLDIATHETAPNGLLYAAKPSAIVAWVCAVFASSQ